MGSAVLDIDAVLPGNGGRTRSSGRYSEFVYHLIAFKGVSALFGQVDIDPTLIVVNIGRAVNKWFWRGS